MTPLLTAALALVCGLNPTQCQAAQTVTIEAVQTAPGVAGAQASYVPRTRTVYITATNAEQGAAQLSHELTHVQQFDAGAVYNASTCYGIELEAFQAEALTWAEVHNNDPAFISPPGWAAVNATDDCHKAVGR